MRECRRASSPSLTSATASQLSRRAWPRGSERHREYVDHIGPPLACYTNEWEIDLDNHDTQNVANGVSDGRTSVGWQGGLGKSKSKRVLLNHFGLKCWGCGFEPPKRYNTTQDERLLQLDHIRPKQPLRGAAGSDELYNLAILCPPCNIVKSNDKTLEQLRRHNNERGFLYVESIDDLVELGEREQFAIRRIFELANKGETVKTLQHIFKITMQGDLTVRNPPR